MTPLVFEILAPLFFTLTILGSCGQFQQGQFSDQELAWLVYDLEEEVVFTNNKNDTLNLIVNFKTELSQINHNYPIEAELSIADSTENVWFKIYLLKDQTSFKKYMKCAAVYRDLDNATLLTDTTLAGKKYGRILLIEEERSDDQDDITRVFFHQGDGVVQFELADNTVYKLKR